MHGARDKIDIRLGRNCTIDGQQGPNERTGEEIRKGEGKLIRRNSKNFVVLSHHPTINNEGDVVQFGIWVGCHDTSRGTREFSLVPKFCCWRIQRKKKDEFRFARRGV